MSIKNNKKLLIVLSMLIVALLSGISYAIWMNVNRQEGTNIVKADCFDVTFNGLNDINIEDTMPLSEEDGIQLSPYTFTVKNICNNYANYQVNLEALSESDITTDSIRFKIDDKQSHNLGDIVPNSTKVLDESKDSREMYVGSLIAGEEKTHNLRLWVDEDATYENSADKTFKAKVVVVSTVNENNHAIALNLDGGSLEENRVLSVVGSEVGELPTPIKKGYAFTGWYSDEELANKVRSNTIVTSGLTNLYAKYEELTATLLPGDLFNKKLKSLSSDTYVNSYYNDDNLIKYFKRSDELKTTTNTISDYNSMTPVYAWYENETIYWYSDANTIYLSDNSACMFSDFKKLINLDLTDFNASKVKSMYDMFTRSSLLESIDLSNWNTPNLENMSGMFRNLNNIEELNLNNFNTSNVTDMSYMFDGDENLVTLNINKWDTSSVNNMNSMFSGNYNLSSLNISEWNTSNVTNMISMFREDSNLTNLDVSNWNVSSLEEANSMFDSTGLTELILNKWNTSKLRKAECFICNSSVTYLDISNWDFQRYNEGENASGRSGYNWIIGYGKAHNLETLIARNNTGIMSNSLVYGFSQNRYLRKIDLTGTDLSAVTNLSSTFEGCNNLEEVDGFFDNSFENVTKMSYLFEHTNFSTLDLSTWNTSKVIEMNLMFYDMKNLTTVYVGNAWNTNLVPTNTQAFGANNNLVGGAGTAFVPSEYGISYAHIDGGVDNPGYFTDIADKPTE